MTAGKNNSKIKVLIAKPGLDRHDVGAKVVVRGLIDAGFEVIYTGLRKSPEQIAAAARDNDVDVIGLSVLSGSHLPLCQGLKSQMRLYQLEGAVWLVGGNIPEHDIDRLKEIGVDGVFRTGSSLEDIVAFIREKVDDRDSGL